MLIAMRQNRAAERFLDSLSGGALETPVKRSAIPDSLRASYDRTLQRLQRIAGCDSKTATTCRHCSTPYRRVCWCWDRMAMSNW